MSYNVFVAGMDPHNLEKLQAVRLPVSCRFHSLCRSSDVQGPERRVLYDLIQTAERELRDFPGRLDAIVGYWDFPVSAMVPLLLERFDLRGPSLKSVLRCEHKYWSRLVQRRAVPRQVPAFRALDPFDDQALQKLDLDFPFWLKPIKSFSSHLGFRVASPRDFNDAVTRIRQQIGQFSEPFTYLLDQIEVPKTVSRITGGHCIAEKIASGHQCTLEGYVLHNRCHTHGIIDTIRFDGSSSFSHFQYPSSLSPAVRARMSRIAEKLIPAFGLNDTAFNIEFFYDQERDRLTVIEVNPRISQSHSDLFEKVDGRPNHHVMLHVALGLDPNWQPGQGPAGCAGKFFLRKFEDAVVRRSPTQEEIDQLEREIPGLHAVIEVKEGTRLRDLPDQDSYSYQLGFLCLSAENQEALHEKYQRCLQRLPFEFTEALEPTA
jgi:hypothetical protein